MSSTAAGGSVQPVDQIQENDVKGEEKAEENGQGQHQVICDCYCGILVFKFLVRYVGDEVFFPCWLDFASHES